MCKSIEERCRRPILGKKAQIKNISKRKSKQNNEKVIVSSGFLNDVSFQPISFLVIHSDSHTATPLPKKRFV